jgi:hypothetical protein
MILKINNISIINQYYYPLQDNNYQNPKSDLIKFVHNSNKLNFTNLVLMISVGKNGKVLLVLSMLINN